MRVVAVALFAFTTALGAQSSPYPVRPVTLLPKVTGDNPEGRIAGITGVVVSKAGRVYVLEGRPCTVKMFDPSGKFMKAFGRMGDGPGQCQRPIGMTMDDTSLTIMDAGPAPVRGAAGEPAAAPKPPRQVMFSLDGKALGVTTLTMQEIVAARGLLRGGTRLGFGQSGKTRLIMLTKPGATIPDTLFRIPVDLATIERSGRGGMGPSGFGDGGAYASSGDSLIVTADGYAGVVKWYAISESGAELKRTENLGMTGSPITSLDVAERVDHMIRTTRVPSPDGTSQPLPPGSIKMTNTPEFSSVATTLMFAVDGSLWVSSPRRALYLTGDPNERYMEVKVTYTVFPPSGAAYAVRLPVSFFAVKVIGDKIYGYTESGGGVITIYQIG